MRNKSRKSAVSILLCLTLIFTQMMPQMVSFALDGHTADGSSDVESTGASDLSSSAGKYGTTSGDAASAMSDNGNGEDAGLSSGTGGGTQQVPQNGQDVSGSDDMGASGVTDGAGPENSGDFGGADSIQSSDAGNDSGDTVNSSDQKNTSGASGDAVDKAYEDSDLQRPEQDTFGDRVLTPDESQAVLDQVKENLGELSGLEEDEADAEDGADIDGEASETADISWYTTDGTHFILTTAGQLKGLAQLTANGESFKGKTVVLGNDIDMTGVEWTLPVGNTENHPFRGAFDGAGYEISNFTLGTKDAPASFNYSGFFGYLEGSVSDLTLQGSIFAEKNNGTLYTGGLAGYAADAEINDVNIYVDITAAAADDIVYAGGIFGVSEDTVIDGAKVQGSLDVSGSENNRAYAGGIVGSAKGSSGSDALIINSGSLGAIDVSGGTVFAGGLAGYATGAAGSGLKIYNDYRSAAALGTNGSESGANGAENISADGLSADVKVTADSGYAGGIVGYAGAYADVQNCYTSGRLDAVFADQPAAEEVDEITAGLIAGGVYNDGSEDAAGTVKSCYAAAPEGMDSENGDGAAVILVGGTAGGTMTGGNGVFDGNGAFPENSDISYYGTLYYALNMWVEFNGDDCGAYYWGGSGTQLQPDTDAESAAASAVTLLMEEEEVIFEDTSWYTGTESDYTLTTGNQLRGLAKLVNDGNTFSGKTIRLGADINIKGDWTPIGKYASSATLRKPFAGVFDGAGHTITFGEGTENPAKVEAPAAYTAAGLFGAVNGAEIFDVNLAGDLRIDVTSNTASIYLYAGGAAGYMYGVSEADGVTSSLNLYIAPYVRTYQSYFYIGGIAGYLSDKGTSAVNCICTGSIQQAADVSMRSSYIGGIAGYMNTNTAVNNSVFAGSISLLNDYFSTYVGGVAGAPYSSGAVVTNCASLGSITSQANKGTYGAVAGYISSGSVKYCYGLADGTTVKAAAGSGFSLTSTGTLTEIDGVITPASGNMLAYAAGEDDLKDGVTPLSYALNSYVGANPGNGFRQWVIADGSKMTEPVGEMIKGPAAMNVSVETTVLPAEGNEPNENGSADFGDQIQLKADVSFVQSESTQPGDLSYKWYVSDLNNKAAMEPLTDSEGNQLTGGTIILDADQAGTKYYYVAVVNSLTVNGISLTSEADSGIVGVAVNKAPGDPDWYVGETEPWAESAGTAEDPHIIATPANLAYLAEQVNGGKPFSGEYFKLADSIDDEKGLSLNNQNWTPIGNGATARFAGIFDGNGKTITDLKITLLSSDVYGGLFGNLYGATLKNFTVKGSVKNTTTSTTVSYVGGVVGYADYESELSDITSDVTIECSTAGNTYIGGIAGYLANSSAVSGCRNAGAVSDSTTGNYDYVGGIAGYAVGSSVTSCTNEGNVTMTTTRSTYIGGIVGQLYTSANITNCVNYGSVTQESGQYGYAGGITGYGFNNSSVYNSYNSGTVTGGSYAGGIYGYGNSLFTAGNLVNEGSIGGAAYNGQLTGYGYDSKVSGFYFLENTELTAVAGNSSAAASPVGIFSRADGKITVKAAEGYSLDSDDLGVLLNTWVYNNGSVSPKLWVKSGSGDELKYLPTGSLYEGVYLPDLSISVTETDASDGSYSVGDNVVLTVNAAMKANPLADGVSIVYELYSTENESLLNPALVERKEAVSVGTAEGSSSASFTLNTENPSVLYYYVKAVVTGAYSGDISVSAKTSSTDRKVWVKPGADDTTFYGIPSDILAGQGTSENPYLISSAADLKRMYVMIDGDEASAAAHYKLTRDIDYNGKEWLPAGNSQIPFTGVFNGDGYSIENINLHPNGSYAGLFGCLKGAEISDVNISGTLVSDGAFYSGSIAGYANSADLSGITASVDTDVSYTGMYTYVGGVVGYALGTVKVKDVQSLGDIGVTCSNAYEISVGGILGYLASGTLTMDGAVNRGDVETKTVGSLNSSSSAYSGGLIGRTVSTTTVSNSVNWGDISCNDAAGFGKCFVSGVAGYCSTMAVKNSANVGDITEGSGASDGRACGLFITVSKASADNFVNYGKITSNSESNAFYIWYKTTSTSISGSLSNVYTVKDAADDIICDTEGGLEYNSVGIIDEENNLSAWKDYDLNYIRTNDDETYASDLEYAVAMWLDDNAEDFPKTWIEEDDYLLPVGPDVVEADQPVISEIIVSTDEENPDRIFEIGTQSGPALKVILQNEFKEGDEGPFYQWYYTLKKNSTAYGLPADSRGQGADTAVFTPDMSQGGYVQYYVVVTNKRGAIIRTATSDFIDITVHDPNAVAWDGSMAAEFAGGDGSEENPFLIENAQQLALMEQLVNEGASYERVVGGQTDADDPEGSGDGDTAAEDGGTDQPGGTGDGTPSEEGDDQNQDEEPVEVITEHALYAESSYRLIADIDLGDHYWTPIGINSDEGVFFTGEFDGGGYTVTNLNLAEQPEEQDITVYSGLFGYTGGYIHDLKLVNVDVQISHTGKFKLYSGSAAGYLADGGILENISVLSGADEESASQAQYDFKSTTRTVTSSGGGPGGGQTQTSTQIAAATAYLGGVAGYADNTEAAILSCDSDMDIYASGDVTHMCIGGIVNGGSEVSSCTNRGNIVSAAAVTDENTSDGSGYIALGGILGCTTMYTTVTGCSNTGTLRGIPLGELVNRLFEGGIAGAVSTEVNAVGTQGKIADCTNSGLIFAEAVVTYAKGTNNMYKYGQVIQGGIIGGTRLGNYLGITSGTAAKIVVPIENCTNEGSGRVNSNITRDGTVTFRAQGGGAQTTDVYVHYDIYAGGIAGYHDGDISDCANRADISVGFKTSGESEMSYPNSASPDTAYVGGLCGNGGGSSSHVYNNYNEGNLSVVNNSALNGREDYRVAGKVGGLFGSLSGTVYNCYNTGDNTSNGLYDIWIANNAKYYAKSTLIGGIAGLSDKAAIYNCYSSGSVGTKYTWTGGLSGYAGTMTVVNSYWSDTTAEKVCGYESFSAAAGSENYGPMAYAQTGGSSDPESGTQYAADLLTDWAKANYLNTIGSGSYTWTVTEEGKPAFGDVPTRAKAPIVRVDSVDVKYHVGDELTDENALATHVTKGDGETGNGSFTYQWYSCSADGSNAAAIDSSVNSTANSEIFKPDTSKDSVSYYYAVVRYTDDGQSGYDIEWAEAKTPVITVSVGYDVRYDGGTVYNGALPEDIISVVSGTALTLPDALECSGFVFIGWQTADGQNYDAGAEFSMPAEDVTFTAQWRDAKQYNVTIAGGDDDAVATKPEEAYKGIAYESVGFVMPDGANYFNKEGYRFTGWIVSSADGSETVLNEDGEPRVFQSAETFLVEDFFDGAFEITAQWSKIYTMTYGTGATGAADVNVITGTLPEDGEYIEGEVITLPEGGDLAYAGHQLEGWRIKYTVTDEESGEDKIVSTVFKLGSEFTMPAADVTASAEWKALTKISYIVCDPNLSYADQVTGNVPTGGFYTPGTTITLPLQGDLKLEGYTFLGWYDVDFDSVWEPGASYTVLSISNELIGTWGKNCVISFTAGDGTGDGPAAIQAVEGKSITLPECTFTAPECTDAGYYYKFAGWRQDTDDDFSIRYKAGEKITVAGDMRFMATYQKTPLWGGSAADSFDNDAKGLTADDAIEIRTAEQLKKLSRDVRGYTENGKYYQNSYAGIYFKLTDDIDLNGNSWQPIGINGVTATNPFAGYFDGNGHTVSDFVIDYTESEMNTKYVGLFGYVVSSDSSQDSISNLTVQDVTINFQAGTSSTIGSNTRFIAYAGAIAGSVNGSMSNCTASGDITISLGYAGGVVGSISDGSLTDCTSNVNIDINAEGVSMSGSDYGGLFAGGIAGHTKNVTVADCTNNGDVYMKMINNLNTVENNVDSIMGARAGVGGIAGRITGGSLSDCENSGSISAEGGFSMGAGGIAGVAEVSISNCENSGDVTYDQHAVDMYDGFDSPILTFGACAGGIAGKTISNISECSNTGAVTILCLHMTSGGQSYDSRYRGSLNAGGLVGVAAMGTVSSSWNAGAVTVNSSCIGTDGKEWTKGLEVYAGGVIGSAGFDKEDTYSARILNCLNSSTSVVPTDNEGEIISEVHNCADVTVICTTVEKPSIVSAGRLIGNCAFETLVSDAYSIASESTTSDDTSEGASSENASFGLDEAGKALKAIGDASGLMYGSENTELTADQFKLGEAAYLLDGGSETVKNKWTQGSGEYPVLGQPRVNKITAESDSNGTVLIGKGGADAIYDTLYANKGDKIFVSAIPTSEEKTITADWTESTPMYTGIMYVRYNTFSGYILDKIFATYDDGTVEEFSSSSFALADDIGAVVTATYKYVEDQTIVVDTWVEPYPPSDSNGGKEPPADEPEPEEGIGNGSGDGEGDGNSGGKTPGNGGTDPKGEDNTGTGINPVPKPTTPVSNPVSVPNVTITPDAAAQVTVPAAEAAEQTPQQPEEPETVEPEAAPDSGGDGEVIEEPEPENVVTNLFEVLSKTMQENPILALLLLLLLLIVIIIAGYSRYRKSKQ